MDRSIIKTSKIIQKNKTKKESQTTSLRLLLSTAPNKNSKSFGTKLKSLTCNPRRTINLDSMAAHSLQIDSSSSCDSFPLSFNHPTLLFLSCHFHSFYLLFPVFPFDISLTLSFFFFINKASL